MLDVSPNLQQIVSDAVLEQAYDWLCHARKDSHHNNDVWHLRFHWHKEKAAIQSSILNGNYCFEPCRTIYLNGETIGIWSARDALVLKALTLVLTPYLLPSLSKDCYHLIGHGGAKACVREVKTRVEDYKFVCRSDVDSYYATINHQILLKLLAEHIADVDVLALLAKMLTRLDNLNGLLKENSIGIGKGNPLSPLLGALYLLQMDKAIGQYCEKQGLRYFRFMDDWLVLCKTRHQLRQVVRIMNRCLEAVKQTKHPFKTYIGRIKNSGFDFLGYRITPAIKEKVTLAWKTIANHIGRLQQLYEQGATETRIAEYVKHWLQWARSGVEIDLQQVLEVIKTSRLGSELVEKGVWG
ncbi:reverse transcriptase/maturase family protein [Marinomonas aquiplantarum]|uniref:Retron-type reverse transcriptase n=1 Tax=Marinomonas aquiplantarum TaxID=491951 RepID=A0A366CW64_9GAMM|nr:reverse transcriptase/maturase family protein [Marinomonas aquiplantarum]RBO81906.1 retron-type reverse transcriptase [Marinomonas aquiplantarum]